MTFSGVRAPNASFLVLLGFLLAACASGDSARTVEVTLDDNMTIDLAETEVDIGETIVFRVTNDEAMRHEFMVGDAAAQEEFAEEMGDGDLAHDTDGGVTVVALSSRSVEMARPVRSRRLDRRVSD